MPRTVVSTSDAPQAIGTYSQAVRAGEHLYISGQIPLDPVTGEMISAGIAAQTERVFKNLQAIAHAADYSFDDVVKLTVYLSDLGAFTTVNEVMAGFFSQPYPARAALEVSALPKGAGVEIDAILWQART